MNSKELREQLARLVAEMRGLIDRATAESRELTAEENDQYTKMEADITGFEERIAKAEKLESAEAFLNSPERRVVPDGVAPQPACKPVSDDERRSMAWNRWLRFGPSQLGQSEARALQADADIYGGYLVAPQQFVQGLIKAMDNLTFVRRLANVQSVPNAESLGMVSLDNDPADPTWTSEIAFGSEDSTMSFGKRELHPHPLAQYLKVSNTLLRKANNAEQIVRDRLAYKLAVVEETAFMTGSGSNQPLGLFTASNDGITTSQDVSTGNSTTAIAADGLINCFYDLKSQYQGEAVWVFHRDAIKQIRKLKDGSGAYLWQPAIAATEPSTILGRPYYVSENAPNTFTTGLYVGLVGVFRFYMIADALGMQIQRVDQLYAATNQTGFFARAECDGMPVLAEAFRRVKLA